MTVIELKEKLILEIGNIENEAFLKQLSIAIEFEKDINEVYTLSPDELIAIRESIQQIDSGNFLTNEEVKK